MKKILGAAMGNCVHVGGVIHFLQLAENEGYEANFLGPAIEVEKIVAEIEAYKPDIVGVSYRLTPENGELLINKLIDLVREKQLKDIKWVFGGTKPVAEVAKKTGFFDFVSDGTDDIDDSVMFLRGKQLIKGEEVYADNIVDRIDSKYPYPLLRHHYGRPSYEETVMGIKEISEAKVLDIISLGPDQNTQQFFFRPDEMVEEYSGAGGVPIRTVQEFEKLKEASKCGNYPLMRCYSGTQDVLELAEVLHKTINNAWCAVPLCWYNELDGRGTRKIEESIAEAQQLMKWHAEKNITVEVNEPHHWALRDAPDVMSVIMAYISAYNAKKMGVSNYIAQYMFNVPNTLSFQMDLARVLAMRDLVESLKDEQFNVYRQTRAGLPFLCADYDVAKGQLAASTYLQMCVEPHLIHVVGYCEADHAASAEEVIESCKIVRGVIRSTLQGNVSYLNDAIVAERRNELVNDAKVTLDMICKEYEGYEDPLANPVVLADCVKRGIIDAPHIVKNDRFVGDISTKVSDGKCVAFSKKNNCCLSELERVTAILERTEKFTL